MNRVFFITLMAMICHVSLAQDTDSTSKLREGKGESIVTINGTDKEGKPKTTRVRVNFVRHSKNAYFGIDPTLEFGWNRFMDHGKLKVGAGNSDLRLDKGPEFAFYPVVGGVYLDKKHVLKLSTALGVTWNTYHFEKDITLQKGQDQLTYTIDEDKHFSKNLLRSKYLTMPLIFSIYPIAKSSFQINLGAEGGILIGAKTKQISKEDGKVKVNGSFNLNPVRYGLRFGLGTEEVNIYAKYYMSDVFATGEGPKDFNTVAIGINIGFF
ncbi:Outer membrane protein beta-barrel domain-containing protein [Arachidicoccus rhizosphaerae]|uniref:Outer membrane protein beta-barrel domain-containing protein n=1 Tax=Arachidicoccus rhizosphaerae TaxID=551991 RepID=A0A1H3ZKP9_9BACT|nr:outer membrane beta-barrel protein [Arachidicoccus rhizosphaerae]SEA24323.1 Outer membrane protein beta-barrel domain-containing protein [Arachidicoccus rhizosphaerae]